MMAAVGKKKWREHRDALSELLDMEFFAVTREFLSIQRGVIRRIRENIKENPSAPVSQQSMNYLAQSLRKAQEIGKIALGAPIEKKQIEFDFGEETLDRLSQDELIERIKSMSKGIPGLADLSGSQGGV